MAFGESGSGKSTSLTLISQIYSKHFKGAKGYAPVEFKSGQSSSAVTTKVKVIKTGNLTLIDSPGTNDPDKKRTDQQISVELVNTIRTILTSANQGINTVVQCIMPDAGGRIKRSSIQSMVSMLLILTSIYEKQNPDNHPRLCVIFNNVSKFPHPKKKAQKYYEVQSEDSADEETKEEIADDETTTNQVHWEDYVQIFLKQIIEEVKALHGDKSDSTFIKQRIMNLFPKENFYFYQIREDEAENEKEWSQMELFLDENINTRKFFIKSGLLEAVHLQVKEREIMVKGMEEMMAKCVHEINHSLKKYVDKTNKASAALLKQKEDIQKLSNLFLIQTRQNPWILQKCSLRGLIMARQCFSCIREDSTLLCQQEVFLEMEKLSKYLGEYAEQAQKDIKTLKQMHQLAMGKPE